LTNFINYLLFFRYFPSLENFPYFFSFLFLLFLFLFFLSFSFLSLSPSRNREALTHARTESTPPLPPWRLPLQPPLHGRPLSCPPLGRPPAPPLLPLHLPLSGELPWSFKSDHGRLSWGTSHKLIFLRRMTKTRSVASAIYRQSFAIVSHQDVTFSVNLKSIRRYR
jgi:hypothetical protein